jgi:D-galactarolactone cycloisomerase
MKIERVEVFPLTFTLDVPRGDGRGLSSRRQRTVIKLTTDEGVHGWGYGSSPQVVRDELAPLLLGEDPRNTLPLWHRLGRAGGNRRWGVGGIDLALWDIKGKLSGLSVAQLLGGAVRERVPAYASLHNYTPATDLGDALEEAIHAARDAGFRAVKLKIGGRPVAEDIRYLHRARAAAGRDVALMADANQTYSVSTAARVGRVLAELDFAWFEEPIPVSDLAGYVLLRQKLDVPIAGFEGVNDPLLIVPALEARAMDIYQPDVVGAGGFTAIPQLVGMATAFGVDVTCHNWDSALGGVATLHLLATVPPWHARSMTPVAPPLEVTTLPRHPLTAELLLDGPAVGPDGTIAVPTAPGLGVEVNPETLEKYAAVTD